MMSKSTPLVANYFKLVYDEYMNDAIFKNMSLNLKLALQCEHEHDWYESKNNEHYDLWILTEGEIQIEYQGAVYHLHPQDAFLFYPDILYKAYAASDKCAFMFIHFDAVIGTNHHALHLFPADGFIANKVVAKELELFHDSFNSYSRNEPFSELLLNSNLMAILCRHMADKSKKESVSPNADGIHHSLANLNPVLIYINHHIMEPISIQELAAIANLSEKYFINYFKKAMGTTPASYINDLKMKRALDLLSGKTLSIKEIAKRVGYSDTYAFSKAFKKTYGVAPTQMDL